MMPSEFHALSNLLKSRNSFHYSCMKTLQSPSTKKQQQQRWQTFQLGGTPRLLRAVSWPWGALGPSCLHRSKPPLWLWADAPAASSAACRSASPRRCCRSCQSGRRRGRPVRRALWTPPSHSHRSYLRKRRGAVSRLSFSEESTGFGWVSIHGLFLYLNQNEKAFIATYVTHRGVWRDELVQYKNKIR